ncbi:MAG: hypothetical protein PHF18_15320 [Methanosarcina sp.]|uniref:hypothetical protein n=1 Tax=Methanosarcina sp. TaxID=2213 RepID=UPI002601C8FA|nr:hypothetical protein [Methanosarcina sp.]MDD3248198.1 hypothetical protein [Methanosarcina sp.]
MEESSLFKQEKVSWKGKPEKVSWNLQKRPSRATVGYKNAVIKLKLYITLRRVTPENRSENKYCGITSQRSTKIES